MKTVLSVKFEIKVGFHLFICCLFVSKYEIKGIHCYTELYSSGQQKLLTLNFSAQQTVSLESWAKLPLKFLNGLNIYHAQHHQSNSCKLLCCVKSLRGKNPLKYNLFFSHQVWEIEGELFQGRVKIFFRIEVYVLLVMTMEIWCKSAVVSQVVYFFTPP